MTLTCKDCRFLLPTVPTSPFRPFFCTYWGFPHLPTHPTCFWFKPKEKK